MVNANEIIDSIKLQLRDYPQETRIRELYERTRTAYQTEGKQGIRKELELDRSKLQTRFDEAIQKVKQDTGLL